MKSETKLEYAGVHISRVHAAKILNKSRSWLIRLERNGFYFPEINVKFPKLEYFKDKNIVYYKTEDVYQLKSILDQCRLINALG